MSIFKKNKKKENVSQDEMMNIKRAAIEAALKKMGLMYTFKGLGGGEAYTFEFELKTEQTHSINFDISFNKNGAMGLDSGEIFKAEASDRPKVLEELNMLNQLDLHKYYMDSTGSVKLKHRISKNIPPKILPNEIESLIEGVLNSVNWAYSRIIRAIEGREFDGSQAISLFD